jgi:hypothetical protein
MIVSPIAEVMARAASHECWISARLDPDSALASLTPGNSVTHAFDHLADRNLELIRNHVDALLADASSSFTRPGHPGDVSYGSDISSVPQQGQNCTISSTKQLSAQPSDFLVNAWVTNAKALQKTLIQQEGGAQLSAPR